MLCVVVDLSFQMVHCTKQGFCLVHLKRFVFFNIYHFSLAKKIELLSQNKTKKNKVKS